MTACDAHLIAGTLADHGHHNPDAITTADMDAAADHVGAARPDKSNDRHTIRAALDTIHGR